MSEFRWNAAELDAKRRFLLVNDKFAEAEVVLIKALETDDPITRHFAYNHLIELYYQLRDVRRDALEKCIIYCRADIDSLPTFIRAYEERYPGGPPRCPSVERLAIIYEKAGETEKAIEVCQQAIALGLQESFDNINALYGRNRGYKARIDKLEKKLERGVKHGRENNKGQDG